MDSNIWRGLMHLSKYHQGKLLVSRYPPIIVLGQVLWGPLPKMFMRNTVPGIDREIWPQHCWVSAFINSPQCSSILQWGKTTSYPQLRLIHMSILCLVWSSMMVCQINSEHCLNLSPLLRWREDLWCRKQTFSWCLSLSLAKKSKIKSWL